jgi:ribosome biogenesis protein SSF1/2
MMLFTNTGKGSYLKIGKLPRGPTVTFRITNFMLNRDIIKNVKQSKPLSRDFYQTPLIVMNGFNNLNIPDELKEPLELTSMIIQSFFPPLNLSDLEIKKCKRVLLFNLIFSNGKPLIEFRHFDIDLTKHSVKKTVS